jgi:hypothetical protein
MLYYSNKKTKTNMSETIKPEDLSQKVEAGETKKASLITRLGLPNLATILRLGTGKSESQETTDADAQSITEILGPDPIIPNKTPNKEPISKFDPSRLKALAATVLITGATMLTAPHILKSGGQMLDSIPNSNTEIVTEATSLEQLLTPDNTKTLNDIYRLRYLGSEGSSKFQMNKENVEIGIANGDIKKYSEMSSFLTGILDNSSVTDKLKPSELKLLTRYAQLFEKENPRTAN